VDDLYERQKRYYHLRAAEYDETAWRPLTEQQRSEVTAVVDLVAALPAARTLDVACGTGFLTEHLRGEITALDASADMLAIAAERVPDAELVVGAVPPLPFPDAVFERVFSSHFYDHLRPADRGAFLDEARRVAGELVLVQQAGGTQHQEGIEARPLGDGSEHEIYKVFFTPRSLLAELGGGEILFSGEIFIVVRRLWA
jgi:demethylmenaquinone methyltransferase/2-methoxy-6-polyprenyl-1,4-benzoquinol methylase